MADTDDWIDDYAEDADEIQIDEYDITASPNDFNVLTIYNFLEAGSVRIPGFQRNYVWDRGRASKLIESLLLGLPVPQVFLYEAGRNEFLVIDGQQRCACGRIQPPRMHQLLPTCRIRVYVIGICIVVAWKKLGRAAMEVAAKEDPRAFVRVATQPIT